MLQDQLALGGASKSMRISVSVFGVASAFAGVLDLVWGNFEPAHQPIQAWGDHIPGQTVLAYLVASCLIAAGTAVLFRRTTRPGALVLAIVYFAFAAFWLPRFYSAPHVLGIRFSVMVGLVAGVAMQLILVAAAAIVEALASKADSRSLERATIIGRYIFGLGSVSFGLVHLSNIPATARMIPRWMPCGADFWTILTGIAFVLAGFAILARVLDVIAARLLALMLLSFDVLVLAPLPFAAPHSHVAWGSNAYNLAAVGAFWIFSELLAQQGGDQVHRRTMDLVGSPG